MKITNVAGHIMTLERKLAYTKDVLAQAKHSERSAVWYRHEADAFEAAIVALRFHRLSISGEEGPVELLRAFVETYEHGQTGRLNAVARKAKLLLEELGTKTEAEAGEKK